jgi:adenylate cyclase class 2
MPINIEIKAHCSDLDKVRAILADAGARRVGLDHQIDTYFTVPAGRMKLRQGTIENNLIFYSRQDGLAPKTSEVLLSPTSDGESLRILLSKGLGVLCVVDKRREIYFHGNVKLHVDEVEGLGGFVEIEVIEESDDIDVPEMQALCESWMLRLGIVPEHLIANSYSDMLGAGS